ncbi:MAG: DUF4194 domain-containing protein [Limisphaerales bacterium]
MIPQSSNNNSLLKISDNDRERLGEALRRLLAHGSILGLEPAQTDLYHWCHQNRQWLDETAALMDLKLHWEHQDRTVQAVPQSSAFILKLKLDATLVLLTLWYEFDTAVRDRGEVPPIRLTTKQLNDSLTAKFEPLRKHLPSVSRLREILSLAQRKNLVRFVPSSEFTESVIEVLPTLKRVIPFQNIDEWNKNADRYLASVKELSPETVQTETSGEVEETAA